MRNQITHKSCGLERTGTDWSGLEDTTVFVCTVVCTHSAETRDKAGNSSCLIRACTPGRTRTFNLRLRSPLLYYPQLNTPEQAKSLHTLKLHGIAPPDFGRIRRKGNVLFQSVPVHIKHAQKIKFVPVFVLITENNIMNLRERCNGEKCNG